MTTFLIKRGAAAVAGKRHAHIARMSTVTGDILGALCREKVDGQWISSNVPWGLRQCKHCLRAYWAAIDRERT